MSDYRPSAGGIVPPDRSPLSHCLSGPDIAMEELQGKSWKPSLILFIYLFIYFWEIYFT